MTKQSAGAAKWVDTAERRRATTNVSGRDQIVLGAMAAIEEHGAEVGTAQIAERAGVPRPHVYRHFDSKQALDEEVARHAATDLVERVRPTMARTGTPTEIVRGVVAEAVGWAAEHPNLYRFLAARQQTKATHRARLGGTRFLGEVVDAATAYLRAGNLDVDAPDGVLAGLMGMVDASIIWWLDHHDEEQDEVVDRVARQVWLILSDMLTEVGLTISDATVLSLEHVDPAG